MDKKEFVGAVGEALIRRLPEQLREGMTWEYEELVKVNDIVWTSLILRREGNAPSPTYYLDGDYEAYLRGRSIDSIAEELADSCVMALKDAPEIEDLGEEEVLVPGRWSHYGVRLLEAARNRRFLEDVPHVEVGAGLVLTFDLRASRIGKEWRTVIRRESLKQSGMSEEELYRLAAKSAWNEDRPYLSRVRVDGEAERSANLLKQKGPVRMEEGQMLVLSTQSGAYGASALFAPGTSQKIGDLLEDGFYAIPSSLHEFLILPESLAPSGEVLTGMLREVNRNVVRPSDVLSDDVYRFSREGALLGNAVPAPDYS